MVLQKNSKVKLWGWCNPDERITIHVDWDTISYTTNGSSGANWMIYINTLSDDKEHTITINGTNTLILNDVVFGEVWVCSGQSNMEMNYNWGLKQYADDMSHAANNKIRFFYIPKQTSAYPQDDVKAEWVLCDTNNVKNFSAAGYFFGRELNLKLKVPVGLINANWGGTPAEAWTPEILVNNDTALKRAASKLNPSNGWPIIPGSAYNAMIYPVTNYKIAGVIWYQGESNVGTWQTYQSLFTTMIKAWRDQWQAQFPFYFVQIAPFAGYGQGNSSALLRDVQTRSSYFPNTGMVVTSDLVDNINDIHPKMKKDVGLRLANYALAQTYDQKIGSYKSPEFSSMKLEKNKIRLYFNNAEDGLVSKGEATDFYVAGNDQKFLPAKAKIEGNTIIVWNETIKNPVAVRFGFTNAAMPNVFSKSGLPVNLFRTDNWDVQIPGK